ncbi:hypothetical protein [Actinomadura flavalba]|uniref:hypothetical protein n=1 Tax=Actinomadura flavalba TaxID=1120938 RepID=UPI000527AB4B|nr:hypothetical protein [Actinomadura flavalba]
MERGRVPPGDREPPDAPMLTFRQDPAAVCGFVAAQAARHGVFGNQAAALIIAAGEVAAALGGTEGHATVRVWRRPTALVCRFQAPRGTAPGTEGIRTHGSVALSCAGAVTTLRLALP